MSTVLFHNGSVYSPQQPFATAAVFNNEALLWLGTEEALSAWDSKVDVVIDLQGRLITPGFVDAHAHIALTGAALRLGSVDGTAGDMQQLLADAAAHPEHLATDITQGLAFFASLGITHIQEAASPATGGLDALQQLLSLTEGATAVGQPEVKAWYGQLAASATDVAAVQVACTDAKERLLGLGGALEIDAETSVENVRDHVLACLQAGVASGVSAISETALEVAAAGYEAAKAEAGFKFYAVPHRLEQGVFLSPELAKRFINLGIGLCVQPLNPAAATDPQAAHAWASYLADGAQLSFASGSPAASANPWAWIRQAAFHPNTEQRISVRSAFAAATRGPLRSIGLDEAGTLNIGAPATFVIWEASDLTVQAQDQRIQTWSTDERSGTPLLPHLQPDSTLPKAHATIANGHIIFDDGSLGALAKVFTHHDAV